jgi:crotonobetainyl-CoA:carnitine CoA-transferase CaiB-like acyl-CoA transferase
MTMPLKGITVLDLTRLAPGPYCTMILADLGADVIKIEEPGPPTGRRAEKAGGLSPVPPRDGVDRHAPHWALNRNKRTIGLNLKHDEARQIFYQLAEHADVVVEEFRPGVAKRLGIDYDTLRPRNPRLIYCAVTGYGETGPLKDKAGYDQVLQAMSGMCVLQGKPDGAPEIVHGSMVDYYAAALVAAGVASALFERERSGQGQFVGVSLLRSALTMQSARMIWAEGEALDIWRDMRSGGITGLHPTREGYLYLSANTSHFWIALCEKTGLTELANDPRYDTVRKRAQHAAEIVPKLRAALMERTAQEWEQLFGDKVPCAMARRIEDMFDHPQVLAEEIVSKIEHPTLGSYRGVARPIKFGRTPGPAPFAAPALGQDSAAVVAAATPQQRSRSGS